MITEKKFFQITRTVKTVNEDFYRLEKFLALTGVSSSSEDEGSIRFRRVDEQMGELLKRYLKVVKLVQPIVDPWLKIVYYLCRIVDFGRVGRAWWSSKMLPSTEGGSKVMCSCAFRTGTSSEATSRTPSGKNSFNTGNSAVALLYHCV